jgi:HlyD family secretion protein
VLVVRVALIFSGDSMGVRSRVVFILIIMLALSATGYFVYHWWGNRVQLPDGLIQANGRIEGDHVTVSSKFAGRVERLLAREGDSVKAGQVLMALEDTQTRARVDQAMKAVEAFGARAAAIETELQVLRKEVPLQIDTAEAQVAHCRSVIAKTGAQEEQARRDAQRFRELASSGVAEQRRREQMDLSWTMARNDLTSSRTDLIRAEKQLAQARLGWDRIRARESELLAVRAQEAQARAAQKEAESTLSDLTLNAPSDGVVLTRFVDVGEVVTAGAPLLDVVDLDRLYLKVYVAEILIGRLRLGLPAQIHSDAFPDRPFPATVRFIASRAEFTPKEVQTPDERTKLVFAVKLYLDQNPDHCLSPGLPADAVIRWNEGVQWQKPRW